MSSWLAAPSAGGAAIALQPGWRRQELPLADALLLSRDRDRLLGHTSLGPHRADLKLALEALPGRDGLSRGQAKLAALALLLAQARHLADVEGHWPLLQLDDLASELDRDHQAGVLRALAGSGAQVIVTGTEAPPGITASRLFQPPRTPPACFSISSLSGMLIDSSTVQGWFN